MARTVDKERHAELARRAFEIVREHGMTNVTMKQIAAELGLSRSNLYWYFGNLTEIFDALLADLVREQYAFLADRLQGVTHPLDMLETWMGAMLEFYRRDPTLLAALVQFWTAGSPGGPEPVVARLLQSFEPVRALAVKNLTDGIAVGLVAPCDPEALVDLCAITVDGALIHQYSRNLDTKPVFETFCRSVLGPLHVAPATTRS